MIKRRERLGVIFDILNLIAESHNSILPTPLLRKSNLSSQGFIEYYAELLQKGFVKEIFDRSGKRFITLTDKGFRFIDKYKTIVGFIEEFEL